jgi:predicted unusual protein kinase regulating ubiquinone biosynthesis (AarF/ABC1/UbiB family)
MRFAMRTVAQFWWYDLLLPRLGLGRVAARGRSARLTALAQRFHLLAVRLGGLMIKVGQFLSSRLDVLPPQITDELAGLQDEVPPVAFPAIRRLAEAELGMPLERAFAAFDEIPVAAASLGQAHRAVLAPDGAADAGFSDVIVKVQRPGIEQIVAVDLAALRRVARWLDRMRVIRDHVDLPALVEEFARTSRNEIDYLHEAANAERFAEDFDRDPRVRTPRIAWERTTRRVLTLSDVTAIKVNDLTGLRAAGIDPAAVATRFAGVMFTQLFEHGYFHADPHPGNVFVTPAADGDGSAWRLTFVDFGMMGEVDDDLRNGLRRLMIAVAARDGQRLVDSIREVGVLLPAADTTELEKAMAQVFARFGGMGFAQLREVDPREFRDFAEEFGSVVRSLPFQLPESFLLVIRSMSLTSGVCSSLDPAFNIWEAVEPFAAQLLRAESGNAARALAGEALDVAAAAVRLPQRFDALVTRVEQGRVTVSTPGVDRRLAHLERLVRRAVSAVLFAGLLVGGALLLPANAALGIVLMSISAIPFAHAVLAGRFGRIDPRG